MSLPDPKYLRPILDPSSIDSHRDFERLCQSGDFASVAKLVQDEPHSPEYLTQGLLAAIHQNNAQLVEFLLRKGAVIDRAVPLTAVSGRSIAIFQLLMEYGWDINTPIMGNGTALLSILDDEPLVKWFLDHGAQVNPAPQSTHGSTDTASDFTSSAYLNIAGSKSSTAVFDMLLARGATKSNSIPLHTAAGAANDDERLPMMAHLIELGYDVNAIDEVKGYQAIGTPLHYAIRAQSLTKGCAYVIARNLGPGAACPFDYCNCGGTNVPLLPQTSSGTTTIGCASWTTQPTANNCPTAAPVIPSGPASSDSSPPQSLPAGATVVTASVSGQLVTKTFVPTTYTQFSMVTATITTTIIDSQSSTATIVVGPSGVGWTPFKQSTGAPTIPAPTVLPSASGNLGNSQVQSGQSSSQPAQTGSSSLPVNSQSGSQPGQTVVTSTVGSQTVTETFVPTTISGYASLTSTLTTTTINPQSSPQTIVIGPGGAVWTPLGQQPSGAPQLPPPTIPPINPYAPSGSQPGSTPIITSAPSTAASASSSAPAAPQSSVSDAFANPTQSETTIIADAPTTITTPLTETNTDGSTFTLSAAIIIVGPGGTWWNGGRGGFGIQGPSCIWPFCPPGGGGSSNDSNDPDDDDHDDDNSTSQQSQDTSEPSTATSTPSSVTSASSSISSSASSTASGQPCSPSCAACNAPPTKLKMPRRSLSERTLNAPGKSLSKRTLKTPADYGGNTMQFLLSEYAFAEWLNIQGSNGGASTGFARQLVNRRYDAAVHGLYGCTSVVVVSQSGMWISHFWEVPSFRSSQQTWGGPRTAADIANFNDHVINQMQNGGPDIPGLRQFTGPGGRFDTIQRPIWAIVTPRGNSGVAGTYRYGEEVNKIKDVLHNLFPSSPEVVIDYQPRSDENSQTYSASGKILFQFDPFEELVRDPNTQCNVFQKAIFRLWVEDRPLYVWQKYWAANSEQLITDFATYNQGKRKRDGPACPLPSKLPQASTETKGTDMTAGQAPDPDATHWVTLGVSGASAGPTTAASSGDGPSGSASTSKPTSSADVSSSNSRASSSPSSGPASTSKPTSSADVSSSNSRASSPPSSGSASTLKPTSSAGGSSSNSPASTSASSTPPPDCMADGAPWMSPTSYCNCGPSATYETISPTDGASSANCAYTTLPSSTIKPVTTSSIPTNIPGVGGVPGCRYALAANEGLPEGSKNFCNCGGVTASLLTTTISGTSTRNCAYKTVPPGGYDPRPPPPPSSTPPPPPPKPTVGPIHCAENRESYSDCWNDVHAGKVESCVNAMRAQLPGRNVNANSPNITQVLRAGASGGEGGKGVTYLMNIGWIPGCDTYKSMVPDNPLGESGDPPD
ncbi:MAG: hypothetical protein Q9217_001028, partial [Psora testacea]